MSKEGNFTRYVCDRPASAHKDGKEMREYVKDGDGSKLSKWHQVTHKDQYGEEVSYTLCDDCYVEYRDLAARQDAEVIDFICDKEA